MTRLARSSTSPPSPSSSGRTNVRRAGFTLFELLLVLLLLAILARASWPIVSWWSRDQTLRQSAADVRVVLGRTRVHAIDTGTPYEFRIEPGGRRFVALPAEIPLDAFTLPGAGTTAASDGLGELAIEYVFGELPEGLSFSMNSSLELGLEPVNAALYGQLEDGDAITETPWSLPIVYQPDGTTDDHRFSIVSDEDGHAIAIELRGLTGDVRTGTVHREGP